jgi:hypothetical protein
MLLALAVSLAACGSPPAPSPSASSSGPSGIYGLTAILNTFPQPVSRPLPGGFGVSTRLPVGGVRLVIRDAGGRVAARVVSDERGIFRVTLPPGSYDVWGIADTRVKTRVIVRPGGLTRAIVRPYYTY